MAPQTVYGAIKWPIVQIVAPLVPFCGANGANVRKHVLCKMLVNGANGANISTINGAIMATLWHHFVMPLAWLMVCIIFLQKVI